MESLTWPWPQQAIRPEKFLNFPVDVVAGRQIARFIGRLKLFSLLHILYRSVGKGAELDLLGSLPFAKTPPEVDQAIAIHDQRHDQGFEFVAPGIGIATLRGSDPSVDDIFNFSANSLLVTFARRRCLYSVRRLHTHTGIARVCCPRTSCMHVGCGVGSVAVGLTTRLARRSLVCASHERMAASGQLRTSRLQRQHGCRFRRHRLPTHLLIGRPRPSKRRPVPGNDERSLAG